MNTTADPPLRRVISGPFMVLFGLGTIIGAGVYVLIGEVAGQAGSWTPISFVLAALVAAFTGLSYSELVARIPRSAGEALYVRRAFGWSWLTDRAGWARSGDAPRRRCRPRCCSVACCWFSPCADNQR